MLHELFKVENHRWAHQDKVKEVISAFLLKQADGWIDVTLKRFVEKRSGQQNRYYWKLLEYLCPELGYHSKDSCHAMVMEECGFGNHVQFRGKEYFERKSSSELDKTDFGKLIEKCFEIAAFLNEDRPPEKWIVLPKVEND